MGANHSQEDGPDPDEDKVNVLGLSPRNVTEVKRVMCLAGPDAPTHCVQSHINYFRQHPEHLERFCGRLALREPRHYSPMELNRDKQFADRAVMHGLALLQILRCSCDNDALAMEHLVGGLIHTHKDLNLTRDILKDYADIISEYLMSRLQPVASMTTVSSWRRFLYSIAEAMSSSGQVTAFQQYWTLHYAQPKSSKSARKKSHPKSADTRQKLIEDIHYTMLVDPESIRKTAALLIQKCQRKILESSPPISTIQERRGSIDQLHFSDEPPCSKLGLCSHCVKINLNK